MAAQLKPLVDTSEDDAPLPPHARIKLAEIHRQLQSLENQARSFTDTFLAFLIASAAEEAFDQLRDDQILREELGDKAPAAIS